MLWWLIRKLPPRIAYGLFRLAATVAYQRNGKRVQRLRSNYQRVTSGQSESRIEDLVKQGLDNAMRYWCDTFRIADWEPSYVVKTVTTEREELLIKAAQSGAGVIVALPHAGNWDHAGLYFCQKGIPVHTVAEHLKPERLFQKFLQHRESMGMTVLDLNAGVMPKLMEFLNEGKLVALVSDRDLSKKGIDVPFFGGIARMPAGAAALAYDTNAHLITAYVGYRAKGIHISFHGPFPVDKRKDRSSEIRRVTGELAQQFESDIAKDPSSWHMQQRVFIDESFQERR